MQYFFRFKNAKKKTRTRREGKTPYPKNIQLEGICMKVTRYTSIVGG